MWQKLRKNATSGSDICDGPSAASVTPAWLPVTLKLAPLMTAISSWSYARITNFANVLANGMYPPALRPTHSEIMFCSAMRFSKKRCGKAL